MLERAIDREEGPESFVYHLPNVEGANKGVRPFNLCLANLVSVPFPQAFAAVEVLVRSCCMSCRMAAILPGERRSDQAS